jgi:hypothetical protein
MLSSQSKENDSRQKLSGELGAVSLTECMQCA